MSKTANKERKHPWRKCPLGCRRMNGQGIKSLIREYEKVKSEK